MKKTAKQKKADKELKEILAPILKEWELILNQHGLTSKKKRIKKVV